MTSQESIAMQRRSASQRVPHRCPLWVHYLLVSPLRKLLEPTDELVGPHVLPGMTVVDAGCGFGYVSLALARLVGASGRVVAVDVEPRAVERLRRRAQKAGVATRIDARACEVRDLCLDDYRGQVDLVVAIHVFHELENQPGFLTQVAALLKPQGRLLVVEPRGHVTGKKLSAQEEAYRATGFRIVERPDLGRKRTAVLLAPPSE